MPRLKSQRKARREKHYEALTQYVQGSFSQSDVRFNVFSRGKQCVANAVSAIAYNQLQMIDSWKTKDLDSILECGDQVYTCVRLKKNIKEDYLLVDEICGNIDVFGESFLVSTGDIYTGLIGDNLNETVIDNVLPL